MSIQNTNTRYFHLESHMNHKCLNKVKETLHVSLEIRLIEKIIEIDDYNGY